MIELTEQQQREFMKEGWPPRALNPATGEIFVMVHQEMFERVRAILEEEDELAAAEEMLPLASEVSDEAPSRESAWAIAVMSFVEIPYHDRPGSKERPAVIVQCDRNNRRLISTLVAGITSNIRHVGREPSQFLVDPSTPEGALSGLTAPSAVKCENLHTVSQTRVKRTLGRLSDALKLQLDKALRAALELPWRN
jgi:mRNA-degrading endonuclease toxin of MazEF toxin-antitoxin module